MEVRVQPEEHEKKREAFERKQGEIQELHRSK